MSNDRQYNHYGSGRVRNYGSINGDIRIGGSGSDDDSDSTKQPGYKSKYPAKDQINIQDQADDSLEV